MESNPEFGRVDFEVLQDRLRGLVINRVNNGEFTERGFARIIGISQPQVHNVLKGARKLSPEIADLMMAKLSLSILDLLTETEIAEWAALQVGAIAKKPPQTLLPWRQVATGTTD